jgi:hypothetical protein
MDWRNCVDVQWFFDRIDADWGYQHLPIEQRRILATAAINRPGPRFWDIARIVTISDARTRQVEREVGLRA